MASYKVPQDVEADDKLLGPFSFRQFIYLIIVAGAITIAWLLAKIFVGLAILPLPIILLFGALALPLRKEQPMETYLAAMIQFYFIRPRKRLWDPDGQETLVKIMAPHKTEEHLTKDLTQDEAEKRLAYLAEVVDSRGWAIRGVGKAAIQENSVNPSIYSEAQQAQDILDTSTQAYRQIEVGLQLSASKQREALLAKIRQPQPTVQPVQAQQPAQVITPQTPAISQPVLVPQQVAQLPNIPPEPSINPHVNLTPYPNMHQSVIQPLNVQPQPPTVQTPQTTSNIQPSPDIIELANNTELSVETIAHEAKRIHEKEGLPEDEVLVSLH